MFLGKVNYIFSCQSSEMIFFFFRDLRHVILEYGKWPIIEKYQRLMKGISAESLLSFVKAFTSQLFVEGLAQGKLTCQVSSTMKVWGLQFLVFFVCLFAFSKIAAFNYFKHNYSKPYC